MLGATGYVAGELLRLLAGHPGVEVAAAVSRSQAGTPLAEVFPHLVGSHPGLALAGPEAAAAALDGRPTVVFSCLPHGESAPQLAELVACAAERRTPLRVVDLSADFRLPDPALYARVYGKPHAAPDLLARFACALPDLPGPTPAGLVAHPGCFTTAITLACAPLQALGLPAEPRYMVSAVTGSTGSGRSPTAGTHHPERHSNMVGYKAPLTHRHTPEIEMLVGRMGGPEPRVLFVPHSGPFARGIYATVQVRLAEPLASETLAARVAEFYAATPFVTIRTAPPHLKEVVGTNRAHLGVAVEGRDAVVFAAIDNLCKGAAGGGVQWMNRMLGLPVTTGLGIPGLGWT